MTVVNRTERFDQAWSLATTIAFSVAVALAGAVLWTAHQEPVLARGVTWLLGRGGAGAVAAPAALGCGLLGIRDGIGAIPESWMAPLEDLEELRELARRLGRAGPAQPGIRPAG